MTGTLFSRLLPVLAFDYAYQTLGASIALPLRTEKFFDAFGLTGYLTTAGVSLYYPWLKERFWNGNAAAVFPGLAGHAPRQILLTACLVVWATRLGSFLISRIVKEGKDSRFDVIKHQPTVFARYWFGQATWVAIVGLPVWIANAIPAAAHAPIGRLDYIGLSLFATSFLVEVVADRQKSAWRARREQKKHSEQFITTGLWGWSRHPNYVGEVGIWTGIWALALPALSSPLVPYGLGPFIGTLSPIFTYLLLTKASGVPPLERSGDKKFGSDPKWQEYKRNVPIFFPWGRKGSL
ncbi:hypothetical protein BOTBODRAFT_103750 [Botryobasidium botryosum FD-172 SS1]|uniref:Uncharacterized protein n=1 Tax=Botryobasidium botryosum (strain FD-172 SS1) TaxID=930990 RepID=A0A067MRW8_BOTB1|nr:hypothetical protein BOTBODRAFT_103750 [Botryobasidium botryosum FD-172 SS1]